MQSTCSCDYRTGLTFLASFCKEFYRPTIYVAFLLCSDTQDPEQQRKELTRKHQHRGVWVTVYFWIFIGNVCGLPKSSKYPEKSRNKRKFVLPGLLWLLWSSKWQIRAFWRVLRLPVTYKLEERIICVLNETMKQKLVICGQKVVTLCRLKSEELW